MDMLPMVTCVMPTYNRRAFVPHAIRYFQRQAYINKELIVIDDGEDCIEDLIPLGGQIKYLRLEKKLTLGAKLNLGCSNATGSIIVHWDDDDWYASYRISYQVAQLRENQTEICGSNQLLYLDIRTGEGFEYRYPNHQKKWLLGSTLCYQRSRWIQNNFKEITVGVDGLFVWDTPTENVTVLDDLTMSVHLIHDENISVKKTDNERWHSYSIEKIKNTLKEDFENYGAELDILPTQKSFYKYDGLATVLSKKQISNIYACLVHEKPDCVIDMVRNLHYNDPASCIIIFSSEASLELEKSSFPFEEFGAVIYPKILSVEHGYLHNFALSCMQFAVENYSFDILTIVDSDQISMKAGYSDFMGKYFSSQHNIGLLSNRPEQVTESQSDVFTAIQAFKEYDLWKPLLKKFPNGEDKFVHWSFWPSTVFTYDAIKDLLKLFKTNSLLKEIMSKTKIWATEEIILPTMIGLLGYDIKLNPCANDLVNYRKDYVIDDLDNAFQKPNAFWVHPINRLYDDELRKHVRQTLNNYHKLLADKPLENQSSVFLPNKVLQEVRNIKGWLSEDETELLMGYTLKACRDFPNSVVVEVGSYHGKATVLLGRVAASVSKNIKVYSIDTHDGVLGSADQGLHHFGPSLTHFKANIEKAELGNRVVSIVDKAKNIHWSLPISLLLIDGLHDYLNICDDFIPFTAHIQIGGFVAFHDYADYYPDVIAFVNGLISKNVYQKVMLSDSLIILQKNNHDKN